MKRLEEVIAELGTVQRQEVSSWIEAAWVRPDRLAGEPAFGEIDVARLRLILELRQVLAVEEDMVPLVLSLVDQVYGLRRQLHAVCEALDLVPEELRGQVLARCRLLLRERHDADGPGAGPG